LLLLYEISIIIVTKLRNMSLHFLGTLAANKNGVPTIVCYPFDEDAYHDLRTDETIREDAEKADETGEKVETTSF